MTIQRIFSTIATVVLVIGIVLIRYFEVSLFQDPLNDYFHSDFQNFPIPDIDLWKTVFSTSLRFLMNMVLSLWILWFLYKREDYLKASLWVFLFAFIILMLAFITLVQLDGQWVKMALFYVRRFLIHPLLLFILVAGCYFLKTRNKKLT